jgi:hypothetical protein
MLSRVHDDLDLDDRSALLYTFTCAAAPLYSQRSSSRSYITCFFSCHASLPGRRLSSRDVLCYDTKLGFWGGFLTFVFWWLAYGSDVLHFSGKSYIVGGFTCCFAGLFKPFILGLSLVPFVSTGSTYGAHQNGWWVGLWDWVGLGWVGLGGYLRDFLSC